MNCERCGEGEGAVRYTEYADGQARKMRICVECADELGFGPGVAPDPAPAPPPADELPEIVAKPALPAPQTVVPDDDVTCAECGWTAAQLNQHVRFGCEHCYEAFRPSLPDLFERLHGAARHVGRGPDPREGETS